MKKKWYQSGVTWACIVLCVLLLAVGFTMGGEEKCPPEGDLQVLIAGDLDIYELAFSQPGSSGGAMNADGSAMERGEVFGWDTGAGERTVTITALNKVRRVVHETTVTFNADEGPCRLELTEKGFIAAEA